MGLVSKEGDKMFGNCLRCGRPLSNKVSVKRGYGSTCYRKVKKEKAKAKEKLKKEIENEVVELNFIDELRERR